MAIDTHCHLDLVAQGGLTPRDALARAKASGVTDVVQIAVDTAGARLGRALAQEINTAEEDLPGLYWTAGIHPEAVTAATDLNEFEAFVRAHHLEDRFLGVGETGLDYFHSLDHVPAQRESLEKHFSLARELGLPVVLHLRDGERYDGRAQAPADALAILDDFPGVRGVLHCFTYGYDEALPFVERGWFVSYSGILTFKNARTVQDGAARLPLESLLVETDAPFLAPVPHRGKPNEPGFVVHTLDFLCELRRNVRAEDPQATADAILSNSMRFLGWKRDLVGVT